MAEILKHAVPGAEVTASLDQVRATRRPGRRRDVRRQHREAVAALNAELELGLTDTESAAVPVRSTAVDSGHFGYMFFAAGTLTIDGGTVVRVPTVDASTFYELGIVSNTVRPAVNNGAIVKLNSGSTWTVTGTSYLTSLTVAADAAVKAPRGKTVTLTVDGTPTALTPGTARTGALTLTVA
ncbi:hypothetical protein ABZ915_14240 [Streptomyces sp. NPDC046915]|uniref:hypothetical protein n=1 Tax=Streptomyces sp. NPDC046915 TaxID=3155257 RepID=UPI0033E02414